MDDYRGTIAQAANLKAPSADAVSYEEFVQVYPQFSPAAVDMSIVQLMLEQANAAVNKNRWHTKHKLGVCLYTAHLLTLWLKTSVAASAGPAAIGAAGQAKGNVTSKSVGGVSVGYGSSDAVTDLAGFGSLKDTVYGQQFASMARLVGRGMMVVR